MKRFRIKAWRDKVEGCYDMEILEQPDDYIGRIHFDASTGYTIMSCASPEYRHYSREFFLRGTSEYLDSAILSIPEEEFSVIMKSLKEFCKHYEWEFDYEVEGVFGSL